MLGGNSMFGEELYLVNKYAKKIRDEKRLIKEQIVSK